MVDYIAGDTIDKCPDTAILTGAAILPAFDPAKDSDPTNVIYTATLTQANLQCDFRKKQNRAKSDISFHVKAVRPAGGSKAAYRVPYFIALTTNGRVLEKKMYWQALEFPAGVAAIDVEAKQEDFELKPKRGRAVINYHYIVGFQLTQAQLAYNKKMGQFEP